MNQLTLTVELCAADRARLDKILEALTAQPVQVAETQPPAAVEEAKPEESKPAAPAATLADVQALVQKLIAPGSNKREKTKEIVRKYADRVSAIPADKIGEVFAALTELQEG